MTLTVGGQVVPWAATSRPLPFELHIQILDHLKSSGSQTLVICCLVCKAWLQYCRPEVSRTISLRAHIQLKRLKAALSSSTYPIGSYTKELILAGDEQIYHIAPIYLARKLPALQRLAVILGEESGTRSFAVHPSVNQYLKHFRTVTELELSLMTLQSFWEFRRFVVALPALSYLHLDSVEMSSSHPFSRPDGRRPQLLSAPKSLIHLSFHLVKWNPLWVWIIPSQNQRHEPRDPRLRPSLTPHEARTIWELFRLPYRNGNDSLNGSFGWSYKEEYQQCKSNPSVNLGSILKAIFS